MATKPDINAVWQDNWGVKPEPDGILSVETDTSKAPALWPDNTDAAGFLVAPLLNAGTWLTLIKVQEEGAINPLQVQALQAIGFRQGSNGRLIHPGYPTPRLVDMMGKILRLPVDTLKPDQVVALKPGDKFEPAVPLEVQAGVRDFWKKRPDVLAEEIFISLSEQKDNLSINMLNLLEGTYEGGLPQSVKNPLRLQVWVSQALSGEINPITESILSLGLQRGTVEYGPAVTDWPEDCQALFRELAEFRGDEPAMEAPLMPELTQVSDGRPSLRTPIAWMEDNTRLQGIIVGLPEDESEVWVTPTTNQEDAGDNPLPFFFPKRRRVAVSAIVDPKLPHQEQSAPTQSGGLFNNITDSTSDSTSDRMAEALFGDTPESEANENATDQPPVRLAELPNRIVSLRESNGLLQERMIAEIRNFVLSGNAMGRHPINLPAGETHVDLIASWRDLGAQLGEYHYYDQAMLDAEVVARDTLLESFNKAQPKTPGGQRSALAVLPAGHFMRREIGTDQEIKEALEPLTFCRVGVHPLLLPEIRERLADWGNREAQSIRKSNPELAVHLEGMASGFVNGTTSLNECSMHSISDANARSQVQDIYRAFYWEAKEALGEDALDRDIALEAFKRMGTDEGRNATREQIHSSLFTSPDEAAVFLQGGNARIDQLADKNRAMFTAISDLARVDVEDIHQSQHPLMIVLDVLERNGLEARDRAEMLAMMNIDLSERMNWVGQLAALQGVSIDMAHTSQLMEKPTEDDASKLEGAGMSRHVLRNGLMRISATTGFLKVGYTRYPFQIGLLVDENDMFRRHLTNRDMDGNTATLMVDSDFAAGPTMHFESIGRLVDLHRVSPIEFGNELEQKGQVLRTEALDSVKPTIYGTKNLKAYFEHNVSARAGLSVVSDLHPVNELVELGYSPASEISSFVKANREILLTGTPAWRKQDGAHRDLEDALRLFQQDFKPIQHLARPERITEQLINELVGNNHAEILVLGAKSSRSRVRWYTRVVTKEDLLKADNDRSLAAEYGILSIKSENPSARKGFQFAVFDLAQTLRPEAIRYLNELRNKNRSDAAPDAPKTVVKRGARQDQGKVAGLAVKDLRGKSSVVVNTLAEASPEDQKKFITKTKLWEAPDWSFLRAPSDEDKMNGEKAMSPVVAAFFDELRKRINGAPPANINDVNQMYAKFVLGIRDQFDLIRTEDELKEALKEGGALDKLQINLIDKAEKHGVRPHVVIGDDVLNGPYLRAEHAFASVYSKARRRSRNDTQWDIKEAKPGIGRRPLGGLTQDQEIDAEDVENELTGAMPMLSRLIRKGGEDYRADLDVSEETVIKTFGFSGIEYGKSMSQADRTRYLNEAYDGFMDLAKLIDVPPQALSLGGTLGLAFGSRGRGGRRAAMAHFEPQNNAINLTRMKGAGSMAHEYGHAFANYLFRVSRGLEGSRAPGDITKTMVRQVSANEDVLAGNLRQPVADAIATVLKNIKYKPTAEGGRLQTLFATGASTADYVDGRTGDKAYWATIEEMFARSFETYVSVALEEKFPGFRNDFLVRNDKLQAWGYSPHETRTAAEKVVKRLNTDEHKKEVMGDSPSKEDEKEYARTAHQKAMELRKIQSQPQLYPGGEELTRIKEAFNHLFATLETKEKKVRHDHLGELEMPVLYSSGSAISERITPRDHEVIAECVMGEVARMCGNEVWVNFQTEIHNDDGELSAGRYRKHQDAMGKLHSVIDLAYNAGVHTAHHEAFHFAQDNLLESDEQAMLNRFFSKESPLFEQLKDALIKDGRSDAISIIERDPMEAQAYAYEQWVKGNLNVQIEEPPAGVFGRVNSFFDRVANMAKGSGFKSPEQLFSAFYQGKLRERHELKLANSQTDALVPNAGSQKERAAEKKSLTQGADSSRVPSDTAFSAADDQSELEDDNIGLRM